jgi:ABC-type multidrug transport system ATPase subunit
MSEEILHALMELFAIIIKQDGGVTEQEKAYVRRFLASQIGEEGGDEYYRFFLDVATVDQEEGQKLTSVLDSVKVLKIGKKINQTLNQKQKIILIVRALELINTEYALTRQRLEIVKTLSDFFRISAAEYESIFQFVTSGQDSELNDPNLLLLGGEPVPEPVKSIPATGLDRPAVILRVPAVNLYFLRYTGALDVYLNGNIINKNTIYLLARGSSIRLPVGAPVYYSDIAARFLSETMDTRIVFEARDIEYTFPGNVKGLQDIRFTAVEGSLVGIMGSSGSGKTTLLNVLSGMYTASSGKVLINGIDTVAESYLLQGVKGYVPQDDLLIEELTVFDNLWYNAKFCFRDLSDEAIREKVNDTLDRLGLAEKKDLKVGSVMNKTISGGQRKRLNIALELIREPAVLFLDEPTSGLSSRDSENVMDLLRELTQQGKLIFVVIHQPSSDLFKIFDRVVILDEGGRLVYYGNPVEAVVYFKKMDQQVNYGIAECPTCGNVNPEQIFNILEARQVDEFGNYTAQRKISPGKWQELYEKEKTGEAVPEATGSPGGKLNVPGWAGQWINYLKRDLLAKLGNRQYMILMLGISPVLALILSYIIRYIADPTSSTYLFRENENIPIYIFMAIIVALFLGLIMSAEEIFRDRKILKREKFLHLSRSSYLAAKITNIFLLSAIQSLVFVLIANSILGIRHLTLSYWLALFSVAACANLIGLIISSAFNSAVTIYIIVPLVMIPMMVLSGAMFSFEKLNRTITSVNKVPVIAEMMPTKWAYEGLMVRQFKNNRFQENFFEMDMDISRNNFKTAYYIPELEDRLLRLSDALENTGSVSEEMDALRVLKNEILREQNSLDGFSFEAADFDPATLDREFLAELTDFLGALNAFYLERYRVASLKKQQYLNTLMEDRKALYYRWLNRYHNESVADHVKKIYEKNKIIESDGRLYQQTDPIYLLPESTRSHFYAPVKYFFGAYIDTYWFNIAFIWLISVILYAILYFDLLRKIITSPIFRRKSRASRT